MNMREEFKKYWAKVESIDYDEMLVADKAFDAGYRLAMEQSAKQEPAMWRCMINGVHVIYADAIPPDDAYDENTLIPLYESPVVPPGYTVVSIEPDKETIDRAVSFALNVSLSADYTWSQYMTDLYKHMIAR